MVKVLLTALVLIAWAALMMADVIAAGRPTAQSMELREGVSQDVAQHRPTLLVITETIEVPLIWPVLLTGLAVVAVILIW